VTESETRLQRFRQAWESETTPSIYDFLLPHTEDRDALILELIRIDLEHRWRLAPRSEMLTNLDQQSDENVTLIVDSTLQNFGWRPMVEDYHDLLSNELHLDMPPLTLILGEYRVRCLWGDKPTHANMLNRFPTLFASLLPQLQRIDNELESLSSYIPRARSLESQDEEPNKESALRTADIQLGDRLDDFQILGKLGEGAFAKVFLAQQMSMQRLVALKVSEDKSNESPVLAGLNHSNIVRVFDERCFRGLHLVYMQYVAGGSLRGVLHQLRYAESQSLTAEQYFKSVHSQTKFSSEENPSRDGRGRHSDWSSTVAWIGSQLAAALAYAHAKGIVHCDVKPDNVLLTQDGVPLLADFNLSVESRLQTQSLDRLGGTLNYMSPEQFEVLLSIHNHREIQAANDVYSLAIVLYEMLTGELPFNVPKLSSPPMRELLTAHLNARRAFRPRGRWTASTRSLGHLLEQALSQDANNRPASASAFRRQLELVRNQPLRQLLGEAPPVRGPWYRSPMLMVFACGLIPNAMVSPVNIMANHQINIDGFDLDYFRNVEEPVVNAVLFPLGLALAISLSAPIVMARRRLAQGPLPEDLRRKAAIRCLQFPWMVALVVFVLWTSSGIIFPLWNLLGAGGKIGPAEFFSFFLSQLLHGLVATGLSMVLVGWAVLKLVYPSLISREESRDEQRWLQILRRLLGQARSALEVTPLVALLAIAVSEQLEKQVSIALAIVGLLGHLIAINLTPKIDECIRLYHQSLEPTDQLARESTL
jgi:serine/threonine protein kinase